MKIAFATTQSRKGSTVIGRVAPLARELAQRGHLVTVLGLDEYGSSASADIGVPWQSVGFEPFVRTSEGKRRLSGLGLVWNMLWAAIHLGGALVTMRPDVVVVVKTLPANVLGAWLYRLWSGLWGWPVHFVLDVDDFELATNALSSLVQRAAVHWAERAGARLADSVAAATPFLVDHFRLLTGSRKPVELIVTGLTFTDAVPARERDGRARLIYLGSISIQSGHRVDILPDMLAQVRERVPGAVLVMAGDGDDVPDLKKAFAERELTGAVEWHGRFSTAEVSALLRNSDLVIDPIDSSVAQRAKSSYRVALAAAAGMPVVSSNVGVRPYLVPDAVAEKFWAAPADATDYARVALALLEHGLSDAERTSLREHARQYQWDALAVRYEQLFR